MLVGPLSPNDGGPTKPGRHELKGGAWTSPLLRATPSSFNDAAASMCNDDTGFRCAVAAETLDH